MLYPFESVMVGFVDAHFLAKIALLVNHGRLSTHDHHLFERLVMMMLTQSVTNLPHAITEVVLINTIGAREHCRTLAAQLLHVSMLQTPQTNHCTACVDAHAEGRIVSI